MRSHDDPIRVTERGFEDVTREEWQALQRSDHFWRLVDQGILKPTLLPNGCARLSAFKWVGSAICGPLRIDCVEKVPGALASLMSHSLHGLRAHPILGPSTSAPELFHVIVGAFLATVERYMSSGLRWKYSQQVGVSSLASGRLRVPDTLRLRARGIRHKVAFDRTIIDRAIPLNKVIVVALRELEALHSLALASRSDLARARAAATLFTDAVDVDVLSRPRLHWIETGTSLLATTSDPTESDLLSLSLAILSRAGIDHTQASMGDVPIAWFIDLETLFERVVQSCSMTAIGAGFSSEQPRGHFALPKAELLEVNPDLLVRSRGGQAVVGDVKYKNWSGASAAQDLYQLLVHAHTYNSKSAFLVYPSDAYEEVYLGNSSTGQRTWLFALDVTDIGAGVERMISRLGLKGDRTKRLYHAVRPGRNEVTQPEA